MHDCNARSAESFVVRHGVLLVVSCFAFPCQATQESMVAEFMAAHVECAAPARLRRLPRHVVLRCLVMMRVSYVAMAFAGCLKLLGKLVRCSCIWECEIEHAVPEVSYMCNRCPCF